MVGRPKYVLLTLNFPRPLKQVPDRPSVLGGSSFNVPEPPFTTLVSEIIPRPGLTRGDPFVWGISSGRGNGSCPLRRSPSDSEKTIPSVEAWSGRCRVDGETVGGVRPVDWDSRLFLKRTRLEGRPFGRRVLGRDPSPVPATSLERVVPRVWTRPRLTSFSVVGKGGPTTWDPETDVSSVTGPQEPFLESLPLHSPVTLTRPPLVHVSRPTFRRPPVNGPPPSPELDLTPTPDSSTEGPSPAVVQGVLCSFPVDFVIRQSVSVHRPKASTRPGGWWSRSLVASFRDDDSALVSVTRTSLTPVSISPGESVSVEM